MNHNTIPIHYRSPRCRTLTIRFYTILYHYASSLDRSLPTLHGSVLDLHLNLTLHHITVRRSALPPHNKNSLYQTIPTPNISAPHNTVTTRHVTALRYTNTLPILTELYRYPSLLRCTKTKPGFSSRYLYVAYHYDSAQYQYPAIHHPALPNLHTAQPRFTKPLPVQCNARPRPYCTSHQLTLPLPFATPLYPYVTTTRLTETKLSEALPMQYRTPQYPHYSLHYYTGTIPYCTPPSFTVTEHD